MWWPTFAAMILQCDQPMHFWSHPLKSSSWNRVTVKFWCQYLQYWRRYLEIFIRHFAAVVSLLETDNISPVYRYIIRYALFWWLVPEKIAFCLQRSETKYRYFIWAKRSTAWRAVMVHSAGCIALLLASFDVALPHLMSRARNRAESTGKVAECQLPSPIPVLAAFLSSSTNPSSWSVLPPPPPREASRRHLSPDGLPLNGFCQNAKTN